MALHWSDVDLAGGVIRVDRAWDHKSKVYVDPKSQAGRRRVPITGVLRDHLDAWLMLGAGEGLVVGRTPEQPFHDKLERRRARKAWGAAELEPIGFHACRHTAASMMIAAGVDAKALSVFMGHASITITLDLYDHLMPGSEQEAAGLLESYLDTERRREEEKARESDAREVARESQLPAPAVESG